MEFNGIEGIRVINASVTAKIIMWHRYTEFSGEEKLLENKYDLEIIYDPFEKFTVVSFYKNFGDHLCRGFCIISLLDTDGNRRFSSTFLFVNESDSRVSYISGSTLRRNSYSLYPNDELTLLIDVCFIEHLETENSIELGYENAFESSFEYSGFSNNRLLADSPLAERLKAESELFRSSLMRQNWTLLYFDKKKFMTLKHIGKILMKINPLKFNSIKDIFEMYIMAGEYEIPNVVATCQTFLKLCRFDYTAEDYLEFATEYEVLKNEIIEMSQADFNQEIEMNADGVRMILPIRNCLWFYRHPKENDFLYFENVMAPLKKNILIQMVEQGETFDFYK